MAEKKETPKPSQTKTGTAKKPGNKSEERRQREMIAELMSSGIDFSPFTIDAGDGVEWEFTPDPMPADTEMLRKAMTDMGEASQNGEGIQGAFDDLIKVIKARMVDEKQKKEFPRPIYGINAIMFFAIHLATGRDGFPPAEA